ncbi:MAG TPA: MotA/TolQ/ExbB proton channel family protein [Gammaproteobacteria bacterium]|nr:MotA/TolQ/ExbB proton channel family protein [Gammaproteobacteria bacterium]
MQGLRDLFSGFAALFAAGGILWLLLILAVALWSLIAERYWYFFFVYPQAQEIALRRWKRYEKTDLRTVRRARSQIVGGVFAETHRSVNFIQSLVGVIFLLGLFGSIGGVMRVLDAQALGGAAGQLRMADGLMRAAVPLLAAGSLVLVALFFTGALRDRADRETRLLADRLRRVQ